MSFKKSVTFDNPESSLFSLKTQKSIFSKIFTGLVLILLN